MAKKDYSGVTSCLHCSNIAPMEIIGNVNDFEKVSQDYGPPVEQGNAYQILKCPSCTEVNIRTYFWHDFMDGEEDVTYTFIYPKNSNFPSGLPPEIEAAYQKAEKVKSIDAEFYALALRRILELVCIDKKAKGKMLADKIKDLATRNEIPNNLIKVAQELKNFGNIGAHAGMGSLSKKEINIAEALCRAVLEYIYSAPYIAQLAELSLKSIKAAKPKK